MKKKFKYIIIILTALILGLMLFFYLNHRPKSNFSKHWESISSDFEIVNDHILSDISFEDKSFIKLADLYSDNHKLNDSVAKIQTYLNDVNFDGGNNPEIIYKENQIIYTYWEQSQYILIYIINDKNKVIKHYKDENYIIDELGNGWYLAFVHHI